ncbi:MAG: glycosyltransferase [Fidelibacterota bacterium]
MSILAFFSLRRYARRMKSLNIEDLVTSAGSPPITLIAPAYNEEATCVEAIKSFLTLNYPEYEILVVNDGSSDNTIQRLIDEFDLIPTPRMPTADIKAAPVKEIYNSRRYPNIWVIDKENGGKSDALNTGIRFCRTPLFCAMDADTLLERDALVRVVRPFLENDSTVATGGIIRIVNGCTIKDGVIVDIRLPKNILAKIQVLEYLRAFLAGRMGWEAIQSTLIISGAFGIFKRATVVEAGGYSTDTVGEDMELIVKLHRHCLQKKTPYKITFVPDPVAWTECPESLKILGRQRDRWQRGLMEVINRHKIMLFNPRYKRIGLFAYPYFYIFEMLGPIIEFPGYISFILALALGRVSGTYILAFFMAAMVFGIALSIVSIGLEELTFRRYPRFRDLLGLFLMAIAENVGYRQLSIYWRIHGVYSYFRGSKGWGKMERKGFQIQEDG